MLADNLRTLRKARGLSQEELAARLHVVRQTVSKWEKGLSVPDAELLIRLAEELETTVSVLLGSDAPPEGASDGIAEQLGRINEQLAIKNRRARRIWKIVAGALIAVVCTNGVAEALVAGVLCPLIALPLWKVFSKKRG